MKVALVTIAYNEERFIKPFLTHIPDWVQERIVLISSTPWHGEPEKSDKTRQIAESFGAHVIVNNWPDEALQRNTGSAIAEEYDWIITLDPDEFLDNDGWEKLKTFIESATGDAYVCEGQHTYWKNGFIADPPESHRQIILIKPYVKFADKRSIDRPFDHAPVWVHHFSWARTDKEVWRKISHYAHAVDFDIKNWYENVWLNWKEGQGNVHPTTDGALLNIIRTKLPKELEDLRLWPEQQI
jgi:glycosyltransferase involved in cell wall biosynthesis